MLTKLSPQSSRFLELLIDHESRIVPFDRVEEHLWREDHAQHKNLTGRRNAALHKLRTELVEQGYKEIKARIVTHQETGYSLVER